MEQSVHLMHTETRQQSREAIPLEHFAGHGPDSVLDFPTREITPGNRRRLRPVELKAPGLECTAAPH